VLLASFDMVTLASLQEVAPGIPRLMIARRVVTDPQILADLTGAIGIVTSKSFLLSDPSAVDRIHAAGLGVLIYTLNDEDGWEQAVALGVDGIITDRAAQLSTWLEQRAADEAAESQGMDSPN
jgi:glycerophosphoryl diester phosphodiesterase